MGPFGKRRLAEFQLRGPSTLRFRTAEAALDLDEQAAKSDVPSGAGIFHGKLMHLQASAPTSKGGLQPDVGAVPSLGPSSRLYTSSADLPKKSRSPFCNPCDTPDTAP